MNILLYDEARTLCHVVRSTLKAAGHRASVSSDPRDAILKLDTALFDIVIVGPAGAPRVVAEYLEDEMPHLPIILAGMEGNAAELDRIHCVLQSPLNLGALVAAVRRIEAGLDRALAELPVTVTCGDGAIVCMASRVTRRGMIVEQAGPGEEFHGFFASAGGRQLTATFQKGEPVEFQGTVKYLERNPAMEVRTVGVCFEEIEESTWETLCRARGEEARHPAPRRRRRSG